MIDHHYGHLAQDSREHPVLLLDALALERAVDAGWTPARTTPKPHPASVSGPPRRRSRKAVDVRWTSGSRLVAASANRTSWSAGRPRSPLTDSNRRPPPYHGTSQATGRNPRQRFWRVSAVSALSRFAADCHRLQPRGSI